MQSETEKSATVDKNKSFASYNNTSIHCLDVAFLVEYGLKKLNVICSNYNTSFY